MVFMLIFTQQGLQGLPRYCLNVGVGNIGKVHGGVRD